jgi:Flp pilus assembly protein TadG
MRDTSERAGFLRSRRGNVAMLFALLLVPLLFAAGAAVDFARAAHARANVQEAADEALLRAARLKTLQPTATDAALTAEGRRIFDAATSALSGVAIDDFRIVFDPVTEQFSLQVVGGLQTTLLAAVGVASLPVDTLAGVQLGQRPYIEIAMALDNTGSMNDAGKIASLKDAARSLVETLFEQANAEVKVGLVPFAQYVNVGPANESQAWVAATGTPGWNGCVGSRNYPANVEDDGYTVNPAPALDGVPCPDKIMPLTDNDAAMLAAIDAMDAEGWTFIPAGLVWGWAVLSNAEPFTQGVTASELEERGGVKALLVLTDGANTRAPSYPAHESADVNLANSLTDELCDNIKADGIVVYSVAFNVSDPTIRALLEDCATTSRHYFDAANAADLAAAFMDIAMSLRNLSLAR